MSISNPFTPEHEAFRKTVREWVEKELAPHALEWDRAGIFPREVFKKAGELGFFGINHDPKYGGSGAGLLVRDRVRRGADRAAATPA